jgi:hypothetical protein
MNKGNDFRYIAQMFFVDKSEKRAFVMNERIESDHAKKQC